MPGIMNADAVPHRHALLPIPWTALEELRSSRFRWFGVPLLLGLLLLQMAASSIRHSATFDEAYHLIAGYAYLQTADPRLSWEHPPLVHVLAGLTMLPRGDVAPFPVDDHRWQAGEAFGLVEEYLWSDNFSIAPELIWNGRWPNMMLTVFFGAMLFLALRSVVGEPAAWVGLMLYAFDPNVIANGQLITTDLPVAGWILIASWRLVEYLRRPGWANFLLAGLAAGLALGIKFSAVLIAPIFLLTALIYKPVEGHKLAWWRRIIILPGMALAAAVVIWAIFGFEVGPLENGLVVPAPTYVGGALRVIGRIERGTPTFLLGHVSETGWWYYFPLVFLLKTPLPLLLLLGTSIAKTRFNWRETAPWWIGVLVFLLAAISSPLQIGYRHILPMLLYAIAFAVAQFTQWPVIRWKRAALGLGLIWVVFEALLAFPSHLSYANELAGGPSNSWRIFADMNVDWGQDLVALRDYLAENPMEDLRLAYFGNAPPAAYGIDARIMPGFYNLVSGPEVSGFNLYTPEPGTYAISATSLNLGLVYYSRDLYRYFRELTPDDHVGRSILIYHIDYPPERPVDRAVVVGNSVNSYTPEELGQGEKHRLITKWTDSGALVIASESPARYLIAGAIPESPWADAVLETGSPGAVAPLEEWLPGQELPLAPDGTPVSLPASFENGITLAGWTTERLVYHPGETFQLVTYWRVIDPPEPPLAVFIHLTGTTPQPIVQWDGWPVSTQGLEPGDVIILSHDLSLPLDAPAEELTVQMGMYNPTSGQRFVVFGSDRLLLTEIEIRP